MLNRVANSLNSGDFDGRILSEIVAIGSTTAVVEAFNRLVMHENDKNFFGYAEDIRGELVGMCVGFANGKTEDFDFSKILDTARKIAEFHIQNGLDKDKVEETLKNATLDKNILQMVADTLTIKTGANKCDMSKYTKEIQKMVVTIVSFGIKQGNLYDLHSRLEEFANKLKAQK